MFKTKTVLETTRGEKRFTLECDTPTTLTELVDVLCDFRSSCVQLLAEQIKAQDSATLKQSVESNEETVDQVLSDEKEAE